MSRPRKKIKPEVRQMPRTTGVLKALVNATDTNSTW